MFSHERLWAAIDTLAERNSLSASGLARKAGLDPTTFNKSKRFAADGRPRWPSTESLAKIMDATGTDIDGFALIVNQKLVESQSSAPSAFRIRTVSFSDARSCGELQDLALLAKNSASYTDFPAETNTQIFAIEVGDDSLRPQFTKGDVLVVVPSKEIKPDERIVLRTKSGDVLVGAVCGINSRHLEIQDFKSSETVVTFDRSDINWIAKLLWASQ